MIAPMHVAFRSPASHLPIGKRATRLCYASSEQIGCMRANCVRCLLGALLAAFLSGGAPVLLCGQQPAAAALSAPQQSSPPVTGYRVVNAGGQLLRVAGNPISLEIGKPLDPAEVAASIKALYRSGNYSDIRAVSEKSAGGVR